MVSCSRMTTASALALLGVLLASTPASSNEERLPGTTQTEVGEVQRQPERAAPEFVPEEPCSRAGGICMRISECPAGQLTEKSGLCPKQRSKGVECCNGLSTKEQRCASRGGQCMPRKYCTRLVRDEQATDCREGESCCILVAL